MRSSINIFSRLLKCHFSSNSFRRISNSNFSNSTVLSVQCFRMSFTSIKCGLSPKIIQALGEILTSQSVNAYRASMVLSVEIPGASWISISKSLAVLSTTFFIFIFPLSFAFMMESIMLPVVVPNGISFIKSVFLSFSSIRDLTLIRPPRLPPL